MQEVKALDRHGASGNFYLRDRETASAAREVRFRDLKFGEIVVWDLETRKALSKRTRLSETLSAFVGDTD